MKQILKYIKENSFYIILFIIFISFLLINIKVVYFGDDYVYLTFRNLNITDYFSKLWGHYLHTNGRFIVHLLVTLFLKMPIIVFQIVNSLLLTGICYFGTTIVLSTDNYQNKNKRSFVLIIMFLLIASLGISIMRESVFWLTGSFNYVYPCFMLLAYWTALLKIDNKKYFVLAIILGFLSSSTVEQNALMTFGLTLLTFLSKYRRKTDIKQFLKDNYKLLILCFVTLIGALTVILSPSQFFRMQVATNEANKPIIDIIKYNLLYFTRVFAMSKRIMIYGFIFNLFSILAINKKFNNKKMLCSIYIASIVNIILSLLNLIILSTQEANIYNYLIILGIYLTYTWIMILDLIKLNKNIFSPLIISLILMIGSQFMMIISPIYGSRNIIFFFVMYAVICAMICYKTDFKFRKIFTLVIFIIALGLNLITFKGYSETKFIDEKNKNIIKDNQDIIMQEDSTITLYRFLNDDYCWSTPYMSAGHEVYYKNYYGIKSKIKWVHYR